MPVTILHRLPLATQTLASCTADLALLPVSS
jgi:hypothetical protein